VKRIAARVDNSSTNHKQTLKAFTLPFFVTHMKGTKQMEKVELYVNKTDYALIKSALNDLLDKVNSNSDFYGVSGNITDLLSQLEEFHYILEVK
jgi:hypothetical protein